MMPLVCCSARSQVVATSAVESRKPCHAHPAHTSTAARWAPAHLLVPLAWQPSQCPNTTARRGYHSQSAPSWSDSAIELRAPNRFYNVKPCCLTNSLPHRHPLIVVARLDIIPSIAYQKMGSALAVATPMRGLKNAQQRLFVLP
jgi:hypothetical protein